jgi:hypothetical protein
MKKFFNITEVKEKKEGTWSKLIGTAKRNRITDYEYATLHKQFGVISGNRILFYLTTSR